MGASLKVDWPGIKADWLVGLPTKDIVAKYGVSKHTLNKRSYRENWKDERTGLRAKPRRIDVASNVLQKMYDLGQDWITEVAALISYAHGRLKLIEFHSAREAASWMMALDRLDAIARRTYGLDPTNPNAGNSAQMIVNMNFLKNDVDKVINVLEADAKKSVEQSRLDSIKLEDVEPE